MLKYIDAQKAAKGTRVILAKDTFGISKGNPVWDSSHRCVGTIKYKTKAVVKWDNGEENNYDQYPVFIEVEDKIRELIEGSATLSDIENKLNEVEVDHDFIMFERGMVVRSCHSGRGSILCNSPHTSERLGRFVMLSKEDAKVILPSMKKSAIPNVGSYNDKYYNCYFLSDLKRVRVSLAENMSSYCNHIKSMATDEAFQNFARAIKKRVHFSSDVSASVPVYQKEADFRVRFCSTNPSVFSGPVEYKEEPLVVNGNVYHISSDASLGYSPGKDLGIAKSNPEMFLFDDEGNPIALIGRSSLSIFKRLVYNMESNFRGIEGLSGSETFARLITDIFQQYLDKKDLINWDTMKENVEMALIKTWLSKSYVDDLKHQEERYRDLDIGIQERFIQIIAEDAEMKRLVPAMEATQKLINNNSGIYTAFKEGVNKIDKLKDFSIVDNKLYVNTEFLFVRYDSKTYPVGEYQIRIDPIGGTLRCHANTKHGITYPHPHVNSNNKFCLGNFAQPVMKLLKDYSLAPLIIILIQFLEAYSQEGRPYITIWSWEEKFNTNLIPKGGK